MESLVFGASPGCHTALVWQKTNLKNQLTLKELVPEGLTQSRAENLLSSHIYPSVFPPGPRFIRPKGLIWVPEKIESEMEIHCVIGIIYLARKEEGTEAVQFLPVQSIPSHWG